MSVRLLFTFLHVKRKGPEAGLYLDNEEICSLKMIHPSSLLASASASRRGFNVDVAADSSGLPLRPPGGIPFEVRHLGAAFLPSPRASPSRRSRFLSPQLERGV